MIPLEINSPVSSATSAILPDNVVDSLKMQLGDEAPAFIEELERVALEDKATLPTRAMRRLVDGGKEGYGAWPQLGVSRSFRALDYETINMMLKCGPVRKALAQKKAGLRSVWRNERSWRVYHPDEKFAMKVKANMIHALPTFVDDMLTSLEYGTFFGNLVWQFSTPEEMGVDCERYEITPGERFASIDKIVAAYPATVSKIRYTADGSFDGFEQVVPLSLVTNKVPAYASLVIPYNGQFRNLWGESWCEPIWALYFWYEVALRSFMRYLERSGTPPVLGRAPSRHVVRTSAGTAIEAMDKMLQIASDVAKSNAVVIPSDRDPQTNEYLYELEYLQDDKRGDQFTNAIMILADLIMGAGMTGDKGYSTSKSGGGDSYAAAEVHQRATAMDNERILDEQMAYINSYLMPHYSQYNLGLNAPQPWILTSGLDVIEQDRLFKLVQISANQAESKAMLMIDWKQVLLDNNIPVLTQDEVDTLVEEKKQEAEENMKRQQEFMKSKADLDGQVAEKKKAGADIGGAAKATEERPPRGVSKASKESR